MRIPTDRPRGGRWQAVLALAATVAAGACSRTVEPADTDHPPYLAIIAAVDGPADALAALQLRYHVKELSGTIPIDTTFTRAPHDTTILAVPAASYSVTLSGLPAQCTMRQEAEQLVVILAQENTGLARYSVSCRPALTVSVVTGGVETDSLYIWDLRPVAGGEARTGTVGVNGSLTFDVLPAGDYDFSLRSLRASCQVTSPSGVTQRVTVAPGGGVEIGFVIRCSDTDDQPRILDFVPSYRDGDAVFLAHLYDAGRDVSSYTFDLTDCNGHSLLADGARSRSGLRDGRTARADSLTVIAAFDIGLPDADLQQRCGMLRVEDNFGNVSLAAERPLHATQGNPPGVASFNAVLNGPFRLVTTLTATDPDNDFVGVFVAARLRDGTLGTADGHDDFGIFNVQGYLGTVIPDLPLTGRILYTDVLSIVVYLVDARGNVTRVEDADTFH